MAALLWKMTLVSFVGPIGFCTIGYCEDDFETDRGNREPAIVGSAVLDDDVLYVDDQDSWSEDASSQASLDHSL